MISYSLTRANPNLILALVWFTMPVWILQRINQKKARISDFSLAALGKDE